METTNKNVKLTWEQLRNLFLEYNYYNETTQNPAINKEPLVGVVVFKASNWPDDGYTLKQRSYRCSSDNKIFHSMLYGNSCFADCLDGSEKHINIAKYDWEVDYCYLP